MSQIVSITSQGQITIPASIRRILNLDHFQKAIIKTQGRTVVIEPIPNILDLGGIFQKKAIKNSSVDTIIAREESAVAQASSNKYRRS